MSVAALAALAAACGDDDGNQCTTDSDCPTGQTCLAGACVPASPMRCSSNLDCGTGSVCARGGGMTACVPDVATTVCSQDDALGRACMAARDIVGGEPTFCIGDQFVRCASAGPMCEGCSGEEACNLATGCTADRDMGPPERDMGPPERDMGPPEMDMGPPEMDAGPPDMGPPPMDAGDAGPDTGGGGGDGGGGDAGADMGGGGGECGNGVIEGTEECDPPAPATCGMLAGCSDSCTVITRTPMCGDLCADMGEECGEPGLPACAMGTNCVDCGCAAPRCGDGFTDPGERCGEPGLSCGMGQTCADCRCTPSICGDGAVDGAEDCGEPGLAACPMGQNCSTTTCQCGAPACGDGTTDMGETCGEPGLAACPAGEACTGCVCQPLCGNNATDPGEQCGEPGLTCPAGQECSGCRCRPMAFCGNSRIDPGETCDPPSSPSCASTTYCSAGCQQLARPSICGNGCLDPGETCGEPGGTCTFPATCNVAACRCELAVTGAGRPFALLGGTTDENLRSSFNAAVTLTSPADGMFTAVAEPGVVLVGQHVMVGINANGALDTPLSSARILGWDGGGAPGVVTYPAQNPGTAWSRSTPENGAVGFSYRDGTSGNFEEDVMSPGCLCEGWGARYQDGATARNGGADSAGNSLGAGTVTFFGTAYDASVGAWFVRSRVTVGGGTLEVTMDYSLRSADRYVAERITLRNLTAGTLTNIRFVRTLDYDVGPYHFDGDTFDFLYPVGGGPQLIRSADTAGDSSEPFGTVGDGETDVAGAYGYGVATVSPFLTCSNGITFARNDPDEILTRDEDGDSMPDCNDRPDGPGESPGDRSGSFVFQVPSLGPGVSVDL